MNEQQQPKKQIDFLTWLKGHGFDIDKMESELSDEWKEFTHEIPGPNEVSPRDVGVMFEAKRGLDPLKKDVHTELRHVTVAPIVEEGEMEKAAQDIAIKRTSQADLGPIRKDEVEPHPFLKFPRNALCFCGSGKKFKKCHLSQIPQVVLKRDAFRIKQLFDQFMKQLDANYNPEDTNLH